MPFRNDIEDRKVSRLRASRRYGSLRLLSSSGAKRRRVQRGNRIHSVSVAVQECDDGCAVGGDFTGANTGYGLQCLQGRGVELGDAAHRGV